MMFVCVSLVWHTECIWWCLWAWCKILSVFDDVCVCQLGVGYWVYLMMFVCVSLVWDTECIWWCLCVSLVWDTECIWWCLCVSLVCIWCLCVCQLGVYLMMFLCVSLVWEELKSLGFTYSRLLVVASIGWLFDVSATSIAKLVRNILKSCGFVVMQPYMMQQHNTTRHNVPSQRDSYVTIPPQQHHTTHPVQID